MKVDDIYKLAIDEIRRIMIKVERLEYLYQVMDIVPVVRCKDCKWWDRDEDCSDGRKRCELLDNIRFEPEFFCAYGERKEE